MVVGALAADPVMLVAAVGCPVRLGSNGEAAPFWNRPVRLSGTENRHKADCCLTAASLLR
jgi:hypothetical protein